MKKIITTLTLSLIVYNSFAQDSTNMVALIDDTLYTSCGYKVIVGDDLQLGAGSTPIGDFKYVRMNSKSLFSYTSRVDNAANAANAVNRSSSGLKFKVIRIEKRGSKKHGYVYYPILKNNSFIKYECDIENAIASGEVIVPDEFKPKPKSIVVEVKQNISVADEIVKLKKLMDDGVLTKEEFEIKKKKLLDQ